MSSNAQHKRQEAVASVVVPPASVASRVLAALYALLGLTDRRSNAYRNLAQRTRSREGIPRAQPVIGGDRPEPTRVGTQPQTPLDQAWDNSDAVAQLLRPVNGALPGTTPQLAVAVGPVSFRTLPSFGRDIRPGAPLLFQPADSMACLDFIIRSESGRVGTVAATINRAPSGTWQLWLLPHLPTTNSVTTTMALVERLRAPLQAVTVRPRLYIAAPTIEEAFDFMKAGVLPPGWRGMLEPGNANLAEFRAQLGPELQAIFDSRILEVPPAT